MAWCFLLARHGSTCLTQQWFVTCGVTCIHTAYCSVAVEILGMKAALSVPHL